MNTKKLEGQTYFDIETLTRISLVLGVETKDLTAPVDSRRNRRKVSRREEVEFSTPLF